MPKQLSEGDAPRKVEIAAGVPLPGDLTIPVGARAIVVFAHGSGSGRHSPRNRFVAAALRAAGFGTLLVDLVASEDVPAPTLEILAERLVTVTEWLLADEETCDLPIAYFGSSTGAAVALLAAARDPEHVLAIVCRGGRPDLVSPTLLQRVEAATLFLVGSLDPDVLAWNRRAARHLRCEHRLDVIEGASHLFEEPFALEDVAERAAAWLAEHTTPRALATRYVHGAADASTSQREDTVGLYEHLGGELLFADRVHAGRLLARELDRYRGQKALVLGVPRGGVPVAVEVAEQLGADLDVFVARKLGAPGQEELALGAVTADGTRFLNREVISALHVSDAYLARVTAEQSAEARRMERRLRGALPRLALSGRTVIVVDDGLATGATMRALVRALRHEQVAELVVAVPVGSKEACRAVAPEVDALICPYQPEPFFAVGAHYASFAPTAEHEMEELLWRSRTRRLARGPLRSAWARGGPTHRGPGGH